jgi:hypothetical protein
MPCHADRESSGHEVSTVNFEDNGGMKYPAEYVVVVREVRLADLASVDLTTRQVDVVSQTHSG